MTEKTRTPATEEMLARMDKYWRAANYLSACQLYLLDNPLLEKPLSEERHQEEDRRPLGHRPRPELHLYPPQPCHKEVRPRHDIRLRPGPRRQRHGRPGLAGRQLSGGLSEHHPRQGGHAAPLQAVLLPRRHAQPRRAGDPGLHQRGRRAGLLPRARLRRRDGQPEPHRRHRRRRRRGGDRPAGHQLAAEQVHQRQDRRRGAAHTAPERL